MATVTIPLNEFASRLKEAIDLARAGTEVLVQDAEGPIAKLVPPDNPPAPTNGKREWKLGLHPGAMIMASNFDDYLTEEEFLRGDI